MFNFKKSFFGKKIYYFLNRKWFFDKIYNECFGQFFFKLGYSLSYKARMNNLYKGLCRGTGKEIICFLKASVYSRFLNFNCGGCLTQRYLNLSIFFVILNLWVIKSLRLLILSLSFDTINGMLSNKLSWKKSLPYSFELWKKVYLLWYYFKGGFDIRVPYKFLYMNPALVFNNTLSYKISRCFSSISNKLKENFNRKTYKFKNLFSIICSIENLQEAWFEIKSKRNNIFFRENDVKILNNLSLDWFEKTSKNLLSGLYFYKRIKKVYVKKSNQNSKRLLIISSSYDKIIQKAILRILQHLYEGVYVWEVTNFETFENYVDPNQHLYKSFSKRSKIVEGSKIYEIRNWIIEPKFSHFSFGFRPNRSIHSALKFIKQTWLPIWFWSVDLIKTFDQINQNRLITEIYKIIEDLRLINELKRIINFDISKSNLLSPFFLNIYLSSLDFYIENLQFNYNIESSITQNFKFFKHINNNQTKIDNFSCSREQIKKDKFISEKVGLPVTGYKSISIYYIRYADDMLFGFNMNKLLVKKIFNNISFFIKSYLYFDWQSNVKNSKLIHGISNLISFLGFKIGINSINRNFKSKHLTRFYKLKANLKRKRVIESERYFKMQEHIISKISRSFLQSISSEGQTLMKQFIIKKIYTHKVQIKVLHALKKSLFKLETEILNIPIVSHISRISNKNLDTPFHLAEQKRLNLLKSTTNRWIQLAQN